MNDILLVKFIIEDRQKHLYPVAAQIKLLVDTPEQVKHTCNIQFQAENLSTSLTNCHFCIHFFFLILNFLVIFFAFPLFLGGISRFAMPWKVTITC